MSLLHYMEEFSDNSLSLWSNKEKAGGEWGPVVDGDVLGITKVMNIYK